MRSTLDQAVTQPTRAQLQAYFRENHERYVTGETITFDHVFFSYGSEYEPAEVPDEWMPWKDPKNPNVLLLDGDDPTTHAWNMRAAVAGSSHPERNRCR